jgi:hypothetical protein
MKKIYALTDYKNHFGSKWKAKPYRSGYDKELLKKYFNKYGFDIEFRQFAGIDFHDDFWKGKQVIYSSSEEIGLYYKSFIEDIVLGLERKGAILLPKFDFLRANNNKVYMEIMRDDLLGEQLSGNRSKYYGTFDEFEQDVAEGKIAYPCVIKRAAGSMSRGVYLAKNKDEAIRYAKVISRSASLKAGLKEKVRLRKHAGYKPESNFQNKFIVQSFVPGLTNDWKVLVYGNHYYILKRGIKDNDFRASGSHYNYKAGSKSEFPLHMLDTIEKIYNTLDVPHLSLDFAYDGKRGYVHEFQAIYFGTSTLEFCDDYYIKKEGAWTTEQQQFDQEEEYVWGIVDFLKNQAQ